jgi:hypothetical protein
VVCEEDCRGSIKDCATGDHVQGQNVVHEVQVHYTNGIDEVLDRNQERFA